MQYLLLARHGNTFAPGQKVVWVGARNDLPLVESGIAQANVLSEVLKNSAVKPNAVYAAGLKRTIKYAQIICDQLQLAQTPVIDKRLNELDYGNWSGLTNDEIEERYGKEELEGWTKYGHWAKSFVGIESSIEEEVKDFCRENIIEVPNNKIVLAVSSNGRLKYFLKLVPGAYNNYCEKANWKVATGKVCLLSYDKNMWQILSWNADPASLISLV